MIQTEEIFTRVSLREDRDQVFYAILDMAKPVVAQTHDGQKLTLLPFKLRKTEFTFTVVSGGKFDSGVGLTLMFSVNAEKYFMKTRCEVTDLKSIVVDLNADLFKLQRRDNYRVDVSGIKHAVFDFQTINERSVQGSLPLVNVSGGGCRVELDAHSKFELLSQQIVKGRLSIPGRVDRVMEAEVRYCRPIGSPSAGIKQAGLQFINVTPAIQQQLFQMVLDIHRDRFSRTRA